MARPGYEADRLRLVLRAGTTGAERVLAENWDRSVSSFVWSSDGRELTSPPSSLGRDRSSPSTRRPAVCARSSTRAGRTQTAGSRIVYGLEHLNSPVEFYAVPIGGGTPQKLTDMNRERLAAVRMGAPEQFHFSGWNNETVYGYLVKPADFDAKKK